MISQAALQERDYSAVTHLWFLSGCQYVPSGLICHNMSDGSVNVFDTEKHVTNLTRFVLEEMTRC